MLPQGVLASQVDSFGDIHHELCPDHSHTHKTLSGFTQLVNTGDNDYDDFFFFRRFIEVGLGPAPIDCCLDYLEFSEDDSGKHIANIINTMSGWQRLD